MRNGAFSKDGPTKKCRNGLRRGSINQRSGRTRLGQNDAIYRRVLAGGQCRRGRRRGGVLLSGGRHEAWWSWIGKHVVRCGRRRTVLFRLESQARYAASARTLGHLASGVVQIAGRRRGVRTAGTRRTSKMSISACRSSKSWHTTFWVRNTVLYTCTYLYYC